MTQYRVLFVVRYLWGDEGISIGLVRLAQGLIDNGWEVGLASSMSEDFAEDHQNIRGPSWFESQGLQHFFVPFPKPGDAKTQPKHIFKSLLRLNQVVHEFKPQVINLHSLALVPYLNIIRLVQGVPFVSTARIEPDQSRSGVKIVSQVNKLLDNFSGDRFIAISTELKDVYEKYLNIPKNRIRLINHGVDEKYFYPPSSAEKLAARQKFNLSPEENVVCIIGRLDPVKGHDILFEALADLKNQKVDVTVLCAGKGGDFEESIKAKPHELNIGNRVQFLGFTNPREVLWASDILVLPSRREGFGWVIPEAMLCGVVPIRTPSAGAMDQIEDGINGFIMPFDKADILASYLKDLFKDKAQMSKISEKSIESARQKFTSRKMTQKTINVYQEIIRKNKLNSLK